MRTCVFVRAAACIGIVVSIISGCAEQRAITKDVTPLKPTIATPQQQPSISPSKLPQSNEVSPPSNLAKTDSTSVSSSGDAVSDRTLQSALEKIYFDYDSSGLSKSARETLVRNADALKKHSAPKIRIEGNCDERGSAEYNLALGERRAKAAQQYLETLGIPSDRLSIISYGKENPLKTGSDEAAWSKNRRDEFKVLAR